MVTERTALTHLIAFLAFLPFGGNGVSVWMLIMGWIPGYGSLYMVHPFISAPNFVSVIPYMGILFPILRRNEVSNYWSSLFLIFLVFCKLYLGYSKFLG